MPHHITITNLHGGVNQQFNPAVGANLATSPRSVVVLTAPPNMVSAARRLLVGTKYHSTYLAPATACVMHFACIRYLGSSASIDKYPFPRLPRTPLQVPSLRVPINFLTPLHAVFNENLIVIPPRLPAAAADPALPAIAEDAGAVGATAGAAAAADAAPAAIAGAMLQPPAGDDDGDLQLEDVPIFYAGLLNALVRRPSVTAQVSLRSCAPQQPLSRTPPPYHCICTPQPPSLCTVSIHTTATPLLHWPLPTRPCLRSSSRSAHPPRAAPS